MNDVVDAHRYMSAENELIDITLSEAQVLSILRTYMVAEEIEYHIESGEVVFKNCKRRNVLDR